MTVPRLLGNDFVMPHLSIQEELRRGIFKKYRGGLTAPVTDQTTSEERTNWPNPFAIVHRLLRESHYHEER